MHRVNEEILDLWNGRSEEHTNGLMPLIYPALKTNVILFVGLNPSFSERGFKQVLAGTGHENLDVNKFFAHPNSGAFDKAISDKLECNAHKLHSYFKKFIDIKNHVGIDWEHVDLFFIRETNQKNMKNRVFEKGETLNDFGMKQIHLSKRLIEASKPKLIVVANALASRVFEEHFSAEFDQERGCHFVEIKGKNTPVFLSSMLTGQRALDNYSFNRLKWHIKKVLN